MNQVLAGVAGLLRRLVDTRVTLAITEGHGPAVALADAGKLERVLINLATNACDAMPEGGQLALTTGNIDLAQPLGAVPAGQYVLLSVSDSGTGMDAATVKRIFEPFFSTKEVGHGTGLGLSIVSGIVAQSGGHIAVESVLGVGTTFRLYFPRLSEPMARA